MGSDSSLSVLCPHLTFALSSLTQPVVSSLMYILARLSRIEWKTEKFLSGSGQSAAEAAGYEVG